MNFVLDAANIEAIRPKDWEGLKDARIRDQARRAPAVAAARL